MLCLQNLETLRALLNGPASLPLWVGTNRTPSASCPSLIASAAEAHPEPRGEKQRPSPFARSLPDLPAAQFRPFRSMLLCDKLRGSLQGRQGEMIFKTKYSQQQKPLESPDHCMLFMLGREGG